MRHVAGLSAADAFWLAVHPAVELVQRALKLDVQDPPCGLWTFWKFAALVDVERLLKFQQSQGPSWRLWTFWKFAALVDLERMLTFQHSQDPPLRLWTLWNFARTEGV